MDSIANAEGKVDISSEQERIYSKQTHDAMRGTFHVRLVKLTKTTFINCMCLNTTLGRPIRKSSHIDYVPTIFSFKKRITLSSESQVARMNRYLKTQGPR